MPRFIDRHEGGRQLAQRLTRFADEPGVIILGLPRGGLPVAEEVARALRAPLDAMLVRKLGVPGQEEVAMGAIADGGIRILNEPLIGALGLTTREVANVIADEARELVRRKAAYRGDHPFPDLRDRTVILVDDGVATGSTMRAAVAAVRAQSPRVVIVAAPVMSAEAAATLGEVADACEAVAVPHAFSSVGSHYQDFPQTSDDEVRRILAGHGVGSA